MGYEPTSGISEVLTSILRGAAKLLGCTSANMVLMDEKSETARVVVATMASIRSQIGEVESMLGAVRNVAFPLRAISSSALAWRAWKERISLETSSLAEIIGPELMPDDGVEAAMDYLGDHRFFLVPVMSGSLSFGIIIFEKPGKNAFTPQQRELLIRYAQRVGEIVDLHMRAVNLPEWDGLADLQGETALVRFLIDSDGSLRGLNRCMKPLDGGGFRFSVDGRIPGLEISGSFMDEVGRKASEFLGSADPGVAPLKFVPDVMLSLVDTGFKIQVEVSLTRVEMVDGAELAVATLHELKAPQQLATHQLVRMALGEASPVVLVGPDLCITSENEAADRLFGYEDGGMAGLAVNVIFRDAQDIGDLMDSQIMYLTSGYYEECALLRRKDGECFPGYVEALLLVDADENPIGYLVRIREQWAPVEKGAGEEHLVRRERLATMGELGAQVAHEIRNPILAIGATLEAMSADVRDPDDRETFESLRSEINRLDMLLRDYLSMAARHNSAVAPVDLAAVVDDVGRLLRGGPRWGSRRLVSKVPAGASVLADPDAIRHVMFNLILNAVEATSGEGTISVSVDSGERDIAIYVDDDGPGLSVSPREVFEPFFTTKAHGTGLGLTVCRRIVQTLGGAVSLRNREEGGCRAAVVLPVPASSGTQEK